VEPFVLREVAGLMQDSLCTNTGVMAHPVPTPKWKRFKQSHGLRPGIGIAPKHVRPTYFRIACLLADQHVFKGRVVLSNHESDPLREDCIREDKVSQHFSH
jgi:hypothetical protein